MLSFVLRHPGVVGADIRVLNILRPGCRHIQHPGVVHLKMVKKERWNREEGKRDFRQERVVILLYFLYFCIWKKERIFFIAEKHLSISVFIMFGSFEYTVIDTDRNEHIT